MDEAIRMELAVVPKEKLLLGVPAYGTLYVSQELQEPALMLSRPAAKDIVVPEGVKAEYSPEDSSVLASWQAGGSTYQAFLEDNQSLQAHLSLAKRYGLRGAAIWRLGLLSPGWWDAVLEVAEPRR